MSIETHFGNLFKPELKSSGRKLASQEKVSLTSGSDTAIHAFIKTSPPFRVTLTSPSIESTSFAADCSCPVAKKQRFCKHIWATLILAQDRFPDFFAAKTDIEMTDAAQSPQAEKQKAYQESAKERASEYRKAQYQKQKNQVKERKQNMRSTTHQLLANTYSAEEEAAMAYFAQNGFPMDAGPSKDILNEAKRKLSRIFHPDKGGSHEESVELNKYCEILQRFF